MPVEGGANPHKPAARKAKRKGARVDKLFDLATAMSDMRGMFSLGRPYFDNPVCTDTVVRVYTPGTRSALPASDS